MITVYGLRNCDSCRKALARLEEQGVAHRFVDFRVDGIDAATVARWAEAVGWETLLNRRGTTWRGLDESVRAEIDAERAIDLMTTHPALMKRPIVEKDDAVLVKPDLTDLLGNA